MLVSVYDLQTYMDISFTNRQQDAAEFVLEGLQSELESFLNRPIEVAEFTETHVIDSSSTGLPTASFFYDYSLDSTQQPIGLIQPAATVYLRNTPIASVSSVSIKGPLVDPIEQEAERDYLVHRWGIEVYRALAKDTVTVTYTAGLDGTEIKAFKILILRAAAREMQNMHDDTVGLKDLETRNVAPLETGFTERELASVKKWRRRRIS